MAMIKLGAGITEINGKCGGVIFRHDQCGQHVQASPRRVKTISPAQFRRRKAFARCARYKTVIEALITHHACWSVWVKQHPTHNKKSQLIHLTLYQAYMKYNLPRAFADLPLHYCPYHKIPAD